LKVMCKSKLCFYRKSCIKVALYLRFAALRRYPFFHEQQQPAVRRACCCCICLLLVASLRMVLSKL
jgi:hypothetical protein